MAVIELKMTINPTRMTKDQALILMRLFQEQASRAYSFSPRLRYVVKFSHPQNPSIELDCQIDITHQILFDKRKDKHATCYVLAKSLGEGGQGEVYLVGSLITKNNQLFYKEHSKFSQQQHVLKISVLSNYTYNIILANRAKHLRQGIVVDNFRHNRQVLTKMVLAKGVTLADVIEKIKLSTKLRLDLTRQILFAVLEQVRYAPGFNMVHRDLKPANIMVDLDLVNQKVNSVTIIDFDAAKLIVDNDTNIKAGTVAYTAPEVSYESTTEKTDVYSLSRVFQELWSLDSEYLDELFELMQSSLPSKRPDLLACIDVLNRVELSDEAGLYETRELAAQARFDLYMMTKADTTPVGFGNYAVVMEAQLEKIKAKLEAKINKIPDTAQATTAFLDVLAFAAFKGLNNKDDVKQRLAVILDEFKMNMREVLEFREYSVEHSYLANKMLKCKTIDDFVMFNAFYQQYLLGKNNANLIAPPLDLEGKKKALAAEAWKTINSIRNLTELGEVYRRIKSPEFNVLKEERNPALRLFDKEGVTTTWSAVISQLQERAFFLAFNASTEQMTPDHKHVLRDIFAEKTGRVFTATNDFPDAFYSLEKLQRIAKTTP